MPSRAVSLERFESLMLKRGLAVINDNMSMITGYYSEEETDTLLAGKSDVAHNHDADYSDIAHDHDADYSAIAHNHDAVYSAMAHHHDAAYADIAHEHDADYADIAHDHDSDYRPIDYSDPISYPISSITDPADWTLCSTKESIYYPNPATATHKFCYIYIPRRSKDTTVTIRVLHANMATGDTYTTNVDCQLQKNSVTSTAQGPDTGNWTDEGSLQEFENENNYSVKVTIDVITLTFPAWSSVEQYRAVLECYTSVGSGGNVGFQLLSVVVS